MTQTPATGLARAPEPEPIQSGPQPRLVALIVLGVGLACIGLVIAWPNLSSGRPDLVTPDTVWPFLLFVAGAMLAEIVYIPVRHGDTFEDQTFFEIVVAIGVLLFAPAVALVGALVGLVLSELLFSRSLVKAMFNVGSYAIATSAMVVLYNVLDAGAERTSLRSVLALLVAALAWEFINLLLLGWILKVIEGVQVRELVRDQAYLSILMAVTAVGVATSAVALFPINPAIALFSVLPAFALWYAFKVTKARVEATDRARWIAEFSSTLTSGLRASQQVPEAADQIRRIFGANDVLVVVDGVTYASAEDGGPALARETTPADLTLAAAVSRSSDEPSLLPKQVLPPNWTLGYAVPLQTHAGSMSVLALGASVPPRGIEHLLPWAKGGRDQWQLKLDDGPVLTSLGTSLSSALRASASMTALRDETAKLTAVVDHATDGIAVFDDEGGVLLWSPAMVAITGLTVDSLAAEPAPAALTTLRALSGFDTGPEGEYVRVQRPDGEQRDLSVSVVAIRDEVGMSVLTVRDITRERRVERMKSDFIATVSHELRTPITPIKGYAQLLSSRWERMTPEKRSAMLGTIEERANHLSRLVDDLLLASRASDGESAKLDVTMGGADLADLVQTAIAASPNLTDRITVSGTSVEVACDPQRAMQCLSNLIGNAGKYSRPESPIRVELGRVEGERWGVVEVIDQGRGIPADELDKVFDRFYRVEDPMTMTTGGSGLGLYISRELARAMGGDIQVESVLDQGSTFTLRLRIAEEIA